jgi:hypothetical protein
MAGRHYLPSSSSSSHACAGKRRTSSSSRRTILAPSVAPDAEAPSSSGGGGVNGVDGDASLPRVDVRQATTPAELRAAAYLRAYCLYTYPEGRSEFAARVRGSTFVVRRRRHSVFWSSECVCDAV